MAMFARMQRRLLRAGGLRLAIGSMIAITYAGNAISVSLPLAGPGLGTAFTFRQFSAHGATRTAAAWVLAVGGILSAVTFALVASVGAIVSGTPAAIVAGVLGAVVTVVPLGAAIAALRRPRLCGRLIGAAVWAVGWIQAPYRSARRRPDDLGGRRRRPARGASPGAT